MAQIIITVTEVGDRSKADIRVLQASDMDIAIAATHLLILAAKKGMMPLEDSIDLIAEGAKHAGADKNTSYSELNLPVN